MNIEWQIEGSDIKRLHDFVESQQNAFVTMRCKRNVQHNFPEPGKNDLIKGMFMCLLTSQQRSGPASNVSKFLSFTPFPITHETLSENSDKQAFIKDVLLENKLTRFINRISEFFVLNHNYLENTDWELLQRLNDALYRKTNKKAERELADKIDDIFLGFGPKQSRNLLQSLGLSKFEIPIDSRIISWLNAFGFPVTLSQSVLQDKGYYHFVMDGILMLCEKADIYPCVFDAAVFSSFDDGGWNTDNVVY